MLARGGLALLALLALGGVKGASAADASPPPSGARVLVEGCAQCHDMRAVSSQRKDRAGWRRTVNEMIWRGAPLLPGEAEALTAYLVSHYGPQAARAPATPDGSLSTLPDAPARALVARACVGCHGLATVVAARKTPAEWRRSVDVMTRLGARLDAREAVLVADYLAHALAVPGERAAVPPGP